MSWKVASEKSGNLIGPGLIHVLGSLCSTTTCRTLSRGVSGLRRHPRGSRRAFYARSCIRTSENTPSTHFVNRDNRLALGSAGLGQKRSVLSFLARQAAVYPATVEVVQTLLVVRSGRAIGCRIYGIRLAEGVV